MLLSDPVPGDRSGPPPEIGYDMLIGVGTVVSCYRQTGHQSHINSTKALANVLALLYLKHARTTQDIMGTDKNKKGEDKNKKGAKTNRPTFHRVE